MQVTAAVAREPRQPLTIEELELDDLRPNEVLVRMVASGVCHTDAIVRDQVYPTPLPAVLGHEGAGVVERIGDSVTTVQPGDHVLLAAAYCGKCDRCRSGQMAYCENLFAADFGGRRPDGTTALSKDGEVISSHFFGQSSFATYANVVEESVVRVDPDVSLEVVAPLGCGIQTGAGAVLNELKPALNSTLVVIGTGAVGSGAIMAGAIAGCARIIAVDIHTSRLDLAKELGATDVINTKNADLTDEILRLTDGRGAPTTLSTQRPGPSCSAKQPMPSPSGALWRWLALPLLERRSPSRSAFHWLRVGRLKPWSREVPCRRCSFRSSSSCGRKAGSPWTS